MGLIKILGIKKLAMKLVILHQTLFFKSDVTIKWCPGPDSNRHALRAGDFKSPVSTYFTTRACGQ